MICAPLLLSAVLLIVLQLAGRQCDLTDHTQCGIRRMALAIQRQAQIQKPEFDDLYFEKD
jgi:hypothetical protein